MVPSGFVHNCEGRPCGWPPTSPGLTLLCTYNSLDPPTGLCSRNIFLNIKTLHYYSQAPFSPTLELTGILESCRAGGRNCSSPTHLLTFRETEAQMELPSRKAATPAANPMSHSTPLTTLLPAKAATSSLPDDLTHSTSFTLEPF